MLNRFFGQKPQEDPKKEPGADQERAKNSPVPEPQRFGFLNRTRQLFNRMSTTVEESDVITEELWEDLEESLLGADVGPSTTLWLIDHLRQRAEREQMRTGAQLQRAMREELVTLLTPQLPARVSPGFRCSNSRRCG